MIKLSDRMKFLFLLSRSSLELSRKMGGQGLGMGDLALLAAVNEARDGRMRPIDLAAAVGLTASGVTRMILPLEKIGVVRREAHERDARSSYVTLTKAGKELFEDVVRWNEEKCEAMFSDVSDKTIKTASDLLRAIA